MGIEPTATRLKAARSTTELIRQFLGRPDTSAFFIFIFYVMQLCILDLHRLCRSYNCSILGHSSPNRIVLWRGWYLAQVDCKLAASWIALWLCSCGSSNLHLRALLALWGLLRLHRAAEGDLPVPRLVIDDLDLLASAERLQHLSRCETTRCEMHKSPLGAAARDDIYALHVAPVKGNEDLLDAVPRDVGKHTRDAEAYTLAGITGHRRNLCDGKRRSRLRLSRRHA